MTRRGFIECGLGLAAATALGRPIRSCIGSRLREASGGEVPTAADYVQDGLIAMWDGIENAGWGESDMRATSWIELVSGTSFNVSRYGAFVANAFIVTSRMIGILGTAAMRSAIGTSVFTVEVVFSSAAVNQPIYMWGNPPAFNFMTLSDYAVRFYSGGTMISQTAAAVGQSTGGYSIVRNGLNGTAYFRGTHLGAETNCAEIGQPTSNLDIPAARTVHSIRLYSRALAAEEIAYNYTIDKFRFDLPD